MRPFVRVRSVLTAATLLATATVTGLVTPVHAQADSAPATTAPANDKLVKLLPQLKEFLHLIQIAKPDVAASQAQAMLDAGLTASDLAVMVDENDLAERFDKAMTRARGMSGLEDLAPRFEQMLRDGRLELARQPKRIDDAIGMLTGTLREQMFAKERLAAAGEYAMPALLKTITSGKDPSLEVAAVQVVEGMKRYAVMPLAAALGKLDPTNQRKVADMLGEIGYPAAVPFLLAVANDEKSPADVRDAARRAVERIGATSMSTSAQFTELARRFFDGEESLVSYPSERTNNVWSYDPFGGLTLTPVPTEIYREVMTMLMARNALALDASDSRALALFVAGDLRRENRLPAEAKDPIFGESPRSASFYAMAAGPDIAQSVIALAADRRDTALVRDGIAAVAQTGGSTNLLAGQSGRAALLECLRYPEKRVQYEAALAIGEALPEQTFPGDFSVVPILASAVRDAGTVIAGVVATSEEDRRQVSGRLGTIGFTTLTGAGSFAEFEPEIAASVGLDLLVVQGSPESAKVAVDAARLAGSTAAVPIVVAVAEGEVARTMRMFEGDAGVVVWPAGGPEDAFKAAIDAAFAKQSGGKITDDEAMDYTVRALGTLQKIAVANSPVFSIRDAEKPLLDALNRRTGGVRLLVADVVALLPGPASQRALIDAAMASQDEAEKIELLTRAAASARRFGNQAEARQVEALRTLVGASSGTLAEAAGRLYGALNLPTDETIKLITKG